MGRRGRGGSRSVCSSMQCVCVDSSLWLQRATPLPVSTSVHVDQLSISVFVPMVSMRSF